MMTWSLYHRIIAAYSHPDRRRGKTMVTTAIIDPLRRCLPKVLEGLAQLAAPCTGAATMCSPSSTTTPPTDPPKPSTAAWKHYCATPSACEASPTTAGAYGRTAVHISNSRCTLNCEEPAIRRPQLPAGRDTP